MCKHLAEDSFNADDADRCLFKCLSHAAGRYKVYVYLYTVPLSSPNRNSLIKIC